MCLSACVSVPLHSCVSVYSTYIYVFVSVSIYVCGPGYHSVCTYVSMRLYVCVCTIVVLV